ncbi:MAG: HD-GYP domain-containing protein [Spirochaetaceae bacterium]|jgi:HD-GYP domain-containing protein (c-di-GMP phosphodiesterase class II)|nr:HD-GYP domain-containing protein [Spirochaetaceae bacterium]
MDTNEENWHESYRSYQELLERVDVVFGKIQENHFIVSDCMKPVVDTLYWGYQKFLEFVVGVQAARLERAKNAVDTAILSAFISDDLRLPLSQTRKVIEAALLHDVGMLCIPSEIREKTDTLSKSEWCYILTHPIQSYKVIGRELHCLEDVALIAMQHHEAWNGKGYPKRLAGADIALEARIISVADAFTAIISDRPYRSGMGGHQAMERLVSDATGQFDPDILKSFARIMGMYPIGSLVELTNGAAARILQYVPGESQLKPLVRIVTGAPQEPLSKGETRNLAAEKGLLIKRPLNRQDVLMDILAMGT